MQHLEAAGYRQLQIEDDDVGIEYLERLQRSETVRRRAHQKSFHPQRRRVHGARLIVIFNEENLGPRRRIESGASVHYRGAPYTRRGATQRRIVDLQIAKPAWAMRQNQRRIESRDASATNYGRNDNISANVTASRTMRRIH